MSPRASYLKCYTDAVSPLLRHPPVVLCGLQDRLTSSQPCFLPLCSIPATPASPDHSFFSTQILPCLFLPLCSSSCCHLFLGMSSSFQTLYNIFQILTQMLYFWGSFLQSLSGKVLPALSHPSKVCVSHMTLSSFFLILLIKWLIDALRLREAK